MVFIRKILVPDYFKKVIKYLYFRWKSGSSVFSGHVALNNHMGKDVTICEGSVIADSVIKDGVFINYNVHAVFSTIGRFCSIGENSLIGLNEHHINKVFTSEYLQSESLIKEIRKQNSRKTILEDDVWVGAKVYIKKGVLIGRGAVLAAGSVVTKDVMPYSIVAGVPAKLVRMRFPVEQIDKLERIQWWETDTDSLKESIREADTIDLFLESHRLTAPDLKGLSGSYRLPRG